MEVDKPDDSSTGDTPEAVADPAVPAIPDVGEAVADPAVPVVIPDAGAAVVNPAVPVIPDAGAGAVQEPEAPALSPPKMEVDKPEDLNIGEAAEVVADPAVPVIPEAVVFVPQPVPAEVPVDSPQPGPSGMHVDSPQPGTSWMHVDSPITLTPGPSYLSEAFVDPAVTIKLEPVDTYADTAVPFEPVAGPSWRPDEPPPPRVRPARPNELLFGDQFSWAAKKVLGLDLFEFRATITGPPPDPPEEYRPPPGPSQSESYIRQRPNLYFPERDSFANLLRGRKNHITFKEYFYGIKYKRDWWGNPIIPDKKPGGSSESPPGSEPIPVVDLTEESEGAMDSRDVGLKHLPGYSPFIFMDGAEDLLERVLKAKLELMINPPEPRSELSLFIEFVERCDRIHFPEGYWYEIGIPKEEPVSADAPAPRPPQEIVPPEPLREWHSLWKSTYQRDSGSRPTTPTIDDNSRNSDLIILDEDALQEAPTAMLGTSRRNTSESTIDLTKDTCHTIIIEDSKDTCYTIGSSKESPSTSIDDASKDTSSTMGTSKRSPPASIIDVSKDTCHTIAIDSSKSSPPASTDTSEVCAPASVDVSKGITAAEDEDAQLEPPTGALGTSERSPPASIVDVSKDTCYTITDSSKPSTPASTDTSKISSPASVDVSKDLATVEDEDAQLEPPTGVLQDEDAQLEPPIRKSVEECLKGFSAVEEARSHESAEMILGIEAPGFLARLSPMVRSPQQSPQRVPGLSRLGSPFVSRDASRQSMSSSVASGTSRKRLHERDEDDEPPNLYRAVDESNETVEFEARQTLATVLSEVDTSKLSSSAASEPSLEGAISMDTSKQSSSTVQASTEDDSSKTTTSTFEEEIYLQPDTFAVAEEDAGSRQSAKDEEVKKAPTLYETLLANEAKAGILPKVVSPADEASRLSSPATLDEASKQSTSSSAASVHAQSPCPVVVPAEREVSKSPEAMEVEEPEVLVPQAVLVAESLPEDSPAAPVGEAAQQSPPGMLVDEAQPGAPEVSVDVSQPVPAEVPVDSPQPGPSGMHVDSPQPGPSGMSAQPKKPVFWSSDESSWSNESSSDSARAPFRKKTLKVFGTRLYLSSLPEDEVEEVHSLTTMASATLQILNDGNAPFRFFVDHFGNLIANQYLMFELVKASEKERPNLNSELEHQCRMNYITMLKIERLIKSYLDEQNINQYLQAMLKYILATVHELDAFNHAIYRYRGLTSLHSRMAAERLWDHFVKLQEKNLSDRVRKKKNVSATSEYVNNLENWRLQSGFYQNFYTAYKSLRDLVQYLRRRYLPDGVVFSLDDLPGMRRNQDPFTLDLAVIVPADLLVAFLIQDVWNHRIVMDRSAMVEYVQMYVSKQFETEDNFKKLLRELVNRTTRRREDSDEEDSPEIQALKAVLYNDYKKFVDELKKIGPFNFLIEEILEVLAKSLDLLICIDKFSEKLTETRQKLRQMVRGGPEEIELKKQFNEYAAELQCVVSGLQEFVFKKMITMQIKLRSIKNDLYGGAYNSFVDLIRLKIHELDRINTNRSMYDSLQYISYTGMTTNNLWAAKVNDIHAYLESRFRYTGQIPLEKLPDAERQFIQKQAKLFSDNTYRRAVEFLLALCTAVGNLEENFRVRIEEIRNYSSSILDNVAGDAADMAADVAVDVAEVAANLAVDDAVAVDAADAAVDEAADVAVDVADAAANMAIDVADAAIDVADAVVDEAAAVAKDVADGAVDMAAIAIDVADAAVITVDVADSAAAVVDVTDAAAVVVDVADATAAVVEAVAEVADVPTPEVGNVDDVVDKRDAPEATVGTSTSVVTTGEIAASTATDEEDL